MGESEEIKDEEFEKIDKEIEFFLRKTKRWMWIHYYGIEGIKESLIGWI